MWLSNLKANWLWRYASEDDALWGKVIMVKLGIDEFVE